MNWYPRNTQNNSLSWVWCTHHCHTSFSIRATQEFIIISRLFIGIKDRKEEKAEVLYLALSLSINHINKHKIASNLNFEKQDWIWAWQKISPSVLWRRKEKRAWPFDDFMLSSISSGCLDPAPSPGWWTHSCRAETRLFAKTVPSLPSV